MDEKVLRARQLYEALTKGGRPPEDRVLARSPEYREMLALGITLCQELGAAEFEALSGQLFGPEDPRSAVAAGVLRHWWAGLSRLYGQDDLGRSRGGESSSANEDYVILKLAMPRHAGRRSPKSGPGLPPSHGHPVKLH
ncbi:hypothetical protein [Fuscibacter oryzae]|uniref:Uncharacterized protein n=1 Tax=Fuscibacter oryzae TaxID=2803939 RepID=A0A8J7N044_9RHOB|nr:hypothetical protein [Fuscibacter oryzae]MBL4930074.1 hypothetical protein [Fuscibacter oryzae]